jgi:hypothetical protein
MEIQQFGHDALWKPRVNPWIFRFAISSPCDKRSQRASTHSRIQGTSTLHAAVMRLPLITK